MAKLDTPESLNITAPKEGFQTGAWYNGRQFWNGQFSDPGVINPLSNQVGAGRAVSSEVNKQSAVAQGLAPDGINKYLATLPGGAPVANAGGVPTVTPPMQGSAGTMDGMVAPTTPNLQELYSNLYRDLGIDEKQKQLTEAESHYPRARTREADNPWSSAGVESRSLARMRQNYERETAPLRNDIATKKADLEMQLSVASQQFDINSRAASQAREQFNFLLDSGALDGASGEDIASITRATGLSGAMIQSAIQNSKNSKLTIAPYDDGDSEYYISIDPAGNIVNYQYVGPSKAARASGGGGFDAMSFMSAFGNDAESAYSEADSILDSYRDAYASLEQNMSVAPTTNFKQ